MQCLHHSPRISNNNRIWRNIFNDYRTGTNLRIVSDGYVAYDANVWSNLYSVLNDRCCIILINSETLGTDSRILPKNYIITYNSVPINYTSMCCMKESEVTTNLCVVRYIASKYLLSDNIARWVPPVALLWYRCFMRTNISYHSCGTAHI